VLKRLTAQDGAEPSPGLSEAIEAPPATSNPWRLRDRLCEAQIVQLITAYRDEATIKEVAVRYGLGTTTVKRLLRQRRAGGATARDGSVARHARRRRSR
jgi:hypothetical protein